MLYESLNYQYNTISNSIRTHHSGHNPKENNNLVSTEPSSDNTSKQNLNTLNNVNVKLNNHPIPIRDCHKTHLEENKFSNVAFLYEQNTNRTIRRNKQIRRIQSKLPIEEIKIEKENQCNKYNNNNNYSKIESCNFLSSTGTLKTCNESPSIVITERVTTEGQTNRQGPIQFIIEDNNLNESDHLAPSVNSNINNNNFNDAEVNISDLDCDINKNDESESVKSQSMCSSTSRSFVSLANNLIIKKDAKEDSSTLSYLLALGQSENPYCNNSISSNAGCGSCINGLNIKSDMSNDELMCKDNKHVRLPSGKNFLISSVIEEEKSDLYTDSEISNKKLSFLLSTKQKLEQALGRSDSDFKLGNNNKNNNGDPSVSKEMIKTSVDKNLDKLFFFNMQKKGMGGNANANYMNNHINNRNDNYIINEISISDSYRVIKEDISTIQKNLKRTYNEIAKEYDSKEEKRKNQIESKKKAVLDLFLYHLNHPQSNLNHYNNQALCHHDIDKEDNSDNSKVNLNISSSDSEQKPHHNCIRKENDNNERQHQKEEIETYEQIHEKYRESRQKQKSSSFFKSEDLKVSKIDDVYLDTSKLVSPMSNEKTDNLFFSSIKSDMKQNEYQKNNYAIDKLNDIKQQLFSVDNKPNIKDNSNNGNHSTSQMNNAKEQMEFSNKLSSPILMVSNEISFNMCSIYLPPKIRERNISMEIIKNTHLQFEGIPHLNQSNNNNNYSKHMKNNSYGPSMKLSRININNIHSTNNKLNNEKDMEFLQGQSTVKLLNNFSSMLSQLKLKNRISSSLGKEISSMNKDSNSIKNKTRDCMRSSNSNSNSKSDNDKKKPIVSYQRFNSSSRDKNIFNKQLNATNEFKGNNKNINMPQFSKPFLMNNNSNGNGNKCLNVTALISKRHINSIPPKKLFNPCIIKPNEKVDNNSKEKEANNNTNADTEGNKKCILTSLNFLLYYTEDEKKEAIKSIEASRSQNFALYFREEHHCYVST